MDWGIVAEKQAVLLLRKRGALLFGFTRPPATQLLTSSCDRSVEYIQIVQLLKASLVELLSYGKALVIEGLGIQHLNTPGNATVQLHGQ